MTAKEFPMGGVLIVIGFVADVIPCLFVAKLWDGKGHSYVGGFWFNLFLTPVLGVIIGLLMENAAMQPSQNNQQQQQT